MIASPPWYTRQALEMIGVVGQGIAMPHQIFTQAMKEIDELTLLAELTLAQIQLKTEELRLLYRKYEEQFPNPAFLTSDPSSRRQPRK